jgi:hypothetical protein
MVRTQIIVLGYDLDLIDFTLFSLSCLFETIVCTLQPSSPPPMAKLEIPVALLCPPFWPATSIDALYPLLRELDT